MRYTTKRNMDSHPGPFSMRGVQFLYDTFNQQWPRTETNYMTRQHHKHIDITNTTLTVLHICFLSVFQRRRCRIIVGYYGDLLALSVEVNECIYDGRDVMWHDALVYSVDVQM